MEMVKLAKADAQRIMDYLVKRPFEEVFQLVPPLFHAEKVTPAVDKDVGGWVEVTPDKIQKLKEQDIREEALTR